MTPDDGTTDGTNGPRTDAAGPMKAATTSLMVRFLFVLYMLGVLALVLLNPVVSLLYLGFTTVLLVGGWWIYRELIRPHIEASSSLKGVVNVYSGYPRSLVMQIDVRQFNEPIPDLSPLFEANACRQANLCNLDEELEERYGPKRCRTCG